MYKINDNIGINAVKNKGSESFKATLISRMKTSEVKLVIEEDIIDVLDNNKSVILIGVTGKVYDFPKSNTVSKTILQYMRECKGLDNDVKSLEDGDVKSLIYVPETGSTITFSNTSIKKSGPLPFDNIKTFSPNGDVRGTVTDIRRKFSLIVFGADMRIDSIITATSNTQSGNIRYGIASYNPTKKFSFFDTTEPADIVLNKDYIIVESNDNRLSRVTVEGTDHIKIADSDNNGDNLIITVTSGHLMVEVPDKGLLIHEINKCYLHTVDVGVSTDTRSIEKISFVDESMHEQIIDVSEYINSDRKEVKVIVSSLLSTISYLDIVKVNVLTTHSNRSATLERFSLHKSNVSSIAEVEGLKYIMGKKEK